MNQLNIKPESNDVDSDDMIRGLVDDLTRGLAGDMITGVTGDMVKS